MPGVPERDEPFVLVATDLAPADTAALAGGHCVALVTEQGGPTSHTAIIARSLGLPAVVGVTGAVASRSARRSSSTAGAATVEVDRRHPASPKHRPPRTVVEFDGSGRLADGHRVALLANVAAPPDAVNAAAARAEGIGLFRTEFCFLDRTEAPTVEEQTAALPRCPGRIHRSQGRRAHAGRGKRQAPPVRELRRRGQSGARRAGAPDRAPRPELLADQLRALALAATAESAEVEVMAPMVATVEEARAFAERARAAGISRVGIMIETPSAALLAAELFEVVDFVSLGTNDLAQYTLAADRLLSDLGDLNDPCSPRCCA